MLSTIFAFVKLKLVTIYYSVERLYLFYSLYFATYSVPSFREENSTPLAPSKHVYLKANFETEGITISIRNFCQLCHNFLVPRNLPTMRVSFEIEIEIVVVVKRV